jgi:Mrp family chromosome partitioning ATPase
MITSATAGEGKTSLTLALGMAFAASGKRTLLIDGDPIARGLTRRLHQDEQPGLLDCFDGGGKAMVQSLTHNVSVLPAGTGSDHRFDAGFGWEELERLLNEELTDFDVILIDTGPVLSSLQTPIVAQVADHVIMTVASGLSESLARQAVRLLRAIDVPVAGFVFNRASARDYNSWIGGESYYTQASTTLPQRYHNGSAPYGPLAASITSTRLARTTQEG